MDLASVGEFGLIDLIGDSVFAPEYLVQGIGDDCAVLPFDAGHYQLLSCDMLNEGVHFLRERITPYQLGYKAVAASFSDIAAMGGWPVNIVLSLGLSSQTTVQWWQAFYEGVSAICRKYRVNIAGGDTTRSDGGLSINVTVLGLVDKDKLHLRSQAKAGDRVFVTGTLGDSRAGLELLLRPEAHFAGEAQLLARHLQPEPCCEEIMLLNQIASAALHGLNDISDGLASECGEIASASGAGIIIDSAQIPLSPETRALAKMRQCDGREWALYGGEDYQLVGTLEKSQAEVIAAQYERQLGSRLYLIGEVVAEKGVFLREDQQIKPLKAKGYTHF